MTQAAAPSLPYVFSTDPGVLSYTMPANLKGYDPADFVCTIENAAGETLLTLVQPTHFTLTLSKKWAVTLTFVNNTYLTSGNKCVVDRQTARTQPVPFKNLSAFPGESVELQLDRVAAVTADIWARLQRTIKARRGEVLPDLPSRDQLAGGLAVLKDDYSGWDILDAAYLSAIGADLALGAGSNIVKTGTYITSIVSVGDEIGSVLLLAPHADALSDLAGRLDELLAGLAAADCPEMTVVV